MNGNFSDVVCQPIVSHGNNQGCGSGGGNDSVCAMGRGRGFCEVKVEESKSENVSCEQFTPNLGDTASDGNFPEVNYWAYNNNFLFPPHLYKRLFEQAIFHKRNYLPTKQEKALVWENPSGVVTSINCGVREKCDNNSSAQKGEDQKDFTSSMNSVMTDHHMPSHGPENNHIWSRGDLGKLRGEHGSSNEMTRKDDDQSDHHMTNAIYPGTAMRSASVSTRSMSPQHGHAGPPAANGSHLLGLPQPLDATKIGSNSQNGPAIGGRKYHCKICSQMLDPKNTLVSF
ncbi:uncharacterized protein LOC129788371 [Lutzomyia longipalpis]|uniref:uncharacterized protein LOC129788371 n=1 Tax=Lutzomyia longipalpis TaxID=7200 RepID=UPI002483ECDE|nr:uncharacterized protein LOC129788371 [Lutzomyia longipalpis]